MLKIPTGSTDKATIINSKQPNTSKNEAELIKKPLEWKHFCPCDLWQSISKITFSKQCLCEEVDLEKELVLFFYETVMEKTFLQEYFFDAIKTSGILPPIASVISAENEEMKITKDIRKLSLEDIRESLYSVGGNQVSLKKIGKVGTRALMTKRERNLAKNRKTGGRSASGALLENSFIASTTEKLSPSITFEYDWLVKQEEKNAKIVFKNGNEYNGDVLDKVPHGKGTFCWSDGTIYEGEFKNGTPTGNGRMQLPDLTEYTGTFSNGYFHGEGVYNIRTTNMVYTGGWNYGKKDGKGWLLYEPGVWYEGEFRNNLRHGKGFFQFSKNNCYEGNYFENKREGDGAMRWANNDVYIGQWSNGIMNGLGEYCWKTSFDNAFCFPVQHHYKGRWVDGKRTGTGIMFFGTENGAKMAGVFLNNFKHGAAIVICGNGRSVERNPLFYSDKPVHVSTSRDNMPTGNSSSNTINGKLFQTNSKENKQLVTKNKKNSSISTEYSERETETICNPIEIDIHSSPEDVELTFYIEKALSMFTNAFDSIQFDLNSNGSNSSNSSNNASKIQLSKWNLMTIYTVQEAWKYSGNQSLTRRNSKLQSTIKNEEKYLRNVIIRHLPNLVEVYYHYALIASPKKMYFKHYMIRMFLWQLYIDIGITKLGISLVEIDQFLDENPSSFVETRHHPFEHIYFFQYVQSLMGTALLVHHKSKEEVQSIEGLTPYIFEKFLVDVVFKKAGSHQGRCLFEYKNLLPIKNVYSLYCKLGEPHTARTFLNMACTRKGEEPPCYKAWRKENSQKSYLGRNVNTIGHNFVFTPEHQDFGEKPDEPLLKPTEETKDVFNEDLSTFRELGPKVIVQCIATICPPILKDGIICNMEYQMTFIEFYEVLICCTLLLVVKNVKKRISLRKMMDEESKNTDVEVSEFESMAKKSGLKLKRKR